MAKEVYQDHLGRTINLDYPPKRIISLCPSITETLFDLGLVDRIVGRTRYCIHPAGQVENVKTVGGTKKIKETVIDELSPDLIIAEKEENKKEMIDSLERKYPVFVTEIKTFEDGLRMIKDLGEITDRSTPAENMVESIEAKFRELTATNGKKVAYVIWQNPYMVAGTDTYIHSMLEKAGFINAFQNHEGRYPKVTIEDFLETAPDVILLASEPFPFQETHRLEFEKQLPTSRTMLIDGEICWYGSRMILVADDLKQLLTEVDNDAG